MNEEEAVHLARVHAALLKLDERPRRVIELRWGIGGHEARTLAATGRCFGISRERVRQIQAHALYALKYAGVTPEDLKRARAIETPRACGDEEPCPTQ
jgi:DNA-directed RNA polymerase sigma subunit (sigma70/sigma32)